jgi:hypothetical protein
VRGICANRVVHRPIETIVHVSQNQVEIRLLRPHVKGGVNPVLPHIW